MSRANREQISIPFGVGICGHVAKTKEIVNLKDAYNVSSLVIITSLAHLVEMSNSSDKY